MLQSPVTGTQYLNRDISELILKNLLVFNLGILGIFRIPWEDFHFHSSCLNHSQYMCLCNKRSQTVVTV